MKTSKIIPAPFLNNKSGSVIEMDELTLGRGDKIQGDYRLNTESKEELGDTLSQKNSKGLIKIESRTFEENSREIKTPDIIVDE